MTHQNFHITFSSFNIRIGRPDWNSPETTITDSEEAVYYDYEQLNHAVEFTTISGQDYSNR